MIESHRPIYAILQSMKRHIRSLESMTAEDFDALGSSGHSFTFTAPDGRPSQIWVHTCHSKARRRMGQFDLFGTAWEFAGGRSTATVHASRGNFGQAMLGIVDRLRTIVQVGSATDSAAASHLLCDTAPSRM